MPIAMECRSAASIALALAWFTAVPAQAASESDSGVVTDRSRVIEEITVTAQRRAETQTEVPISVATFSGDELEQQNIRTISDLQRIVPGLTLTLAGAHLQPTIRGVGTQVSGAGQPSNVAVYVDGVYRPNAQFNDAIFQDIASVQVLKGPQGTLYGRNATGGAVLVTTRAPSAATEARISATWRDLNEEQYNVFLATPISDTLSGSLSLFGKRSDGWKRNIVPGVPDEETRNWAARGKFVYTPTPDMSFTLTVERIDLRDDYVFAFTNYEGVATASLLGGLNASQPRRYSNDFRPIFQAQSTGVFLTGEFDLPWGSLTSTTGGEWQEKKSGYDVDGSELEIQHVFFPGEYETFSQALDFASDTDDTFEWVAGIFLMRDVNEESLFLISPPGPFQILEGEVKTESVATYIDGTYHITPDLHLSAGLRYSRDKLKNSYSNPAGLSDDKTFSATTPRLTLRYDLNDSSSVYASYTEGYKAGGFNQFGVSTATVDQEEIKSYEIGYKASYGNWELQSAAFYYDYTDLQVTTYDGAATNLLNAASAEITGAEVQIMTRPIPGLQLDFSLSYLDAEYDEFLDAPRYVWDPAAGVSEFPDDASGNRLVNSPEFSGRIGAAYTHNTSNGSLLLSANYSYQSKVIFDRFGEVQQDGYGLLYLSAGWESAAQRWSVRGFVENATDEDYVTSVFQQPITFSASYAPGRVYGVEFRLNYGD